MLSTLYTGNYLRFTDLLIPPYVFENSLGDVQSGAAGGARICAWKAGAGLMAGLMATMFNLISTNSYLFP